MDVQVENLEGMSQDELIAMEDAEVMAEETEEVAAPEKEAEPEQTPEAKPEAKVEEEPEPEPEPKIEEEPDKPNFDEVIKHVSPPKKWAAKRAAERDAKDALKAAESLQDENAKLQQELEWMKSQASSKGIDTEKTPADMLTPEKIAAVREEFGDELADMFQAVKAQRVVTPTAPVVEPEATGNTEMDAAIADNDELSYWREHSKDLWERAVAKNQDFIDDPAFLKLSFDERFYHVVKHVKEDVLKEAKESAPKKEESNKPPESLSSVGSPPPTEKQTSKVDDIMNANPEEQAKMYNALTEAERDEVDLAIGI